MSLTVSSTQTPPSGKITSFQLAGPPDVPALTDYLHMVMENQLDVLELCWPADSEFYSLFLRSSGRSGEVRWSLHLASNLLWDYVTCDVLLIHNMTVMAGSKQGPSVQGEGLLATNDVYRNLKQSPDTYFIHTEVPLDPDSMAALGSNGEVSSNPTSAKTILPKPIDSTAIESVMLKLRDSATGLYTYPAFLYFLEQAYFLSCRTRVPISIVIIELRNELEKNTPITKELLFELVTQLASVKRRTDMLARYDSNSIIVLAPSTDHHGLKTFAGRLYQRLVTILSSNEKTNVSPYIGTATLPSDGESMGMLLAAAEAAKNYAAGLDGIHLASFNDIK